MGGNFWLAERRSASEETSPMETMVYVLRNACQFKVCKTALCFLFTGYCLSQLRIFRSAASSRCVRRYCSPCYPYHFLLEAIYSTREKRRGSLLGHYTYKPSFKTNVATCCRILRKISSWFVTKCIQLSWFYTERRGC